MRLGRSPRVGDQLELWAGPDGLSPEEMKLPWAGRSPRGLTRVHLGLILKPRGVKSVSDLFEPIQIDLWPAKFEKPPEQYRGAPSLLPSGPAQSSN